jgi:hypothetical protein
MKFASLVILFLSFQAVAQTPAWPSLVVKNHNQKTLAQVCKNTSDRIQKKICKSLKKTELEESKKIKWTIEDKLTARLRYLDADIKVRRTKEPTTYLVNRKSLYLEEVESFEDLKKKFSKLSGQDNQLAVAAALLMIYEAAEHQSCKAAEKIITQCLKIKDVKADQLQKPNFQKTFQLISAESEKLNQLNTYFSPSKKDSLNQCACKNMRCGLSKDAKLNTAKDYTLCLKEVKSIAQQLKKEKIENEGFSQFAKTVQSLEKREKPRLPALFKEDSYKD